MNKNKGFTLVELLATIAIIAAIFTIAIISLNGVSKKKKEVAYEKVKNEAENAAEDYFNVNKYILNNLKSGDSALISVKKLVEEDYLNKVIDPRNKTPLASCIKVTKNSSGGYSYKYQETLNAEDKTMCDNNNVIIVTPKGSPKVTTQITGKIGNNGWYISAVETSATAEENGNGKIKSFSYQTSYGNAGVSSSDNKLSQTNDSDKWDGKNVTVTYTATNVDGYTATAKIKYKKDTVKPTCDYTLNKTVSSTGWFNITTGKPTITFNGSDAGSGLYSNASYIIKNIKEGDNNYSQKFEDNAGNDQTCSVNIKYDSIKPDCKISINGTEGKIQEISGNSSKRYLKATTKLTGWYTSNATLSINGTNELSNYGLSNTKYEFNNTKQVTQGTTGDIGVTWYLSEADVAGNECKSSKNIKVDTEKPEITNSGGGKVSCTGKNGPKYWGYSVEYKDNNPVSTLYLLEYYSAKKCKDYYWAEGSIKDTNDNSNNPKVYTAFAECQNNSNPRARFQVADAAGNVSDAVLITAEKTNTSMQEGDCSNAKWYNK